MNCQPSVPKHGEVTLGTGSWCNVKTQIPPKLSAKRCLGSCGLAVAEAWARDRTRDPLPPSPLKTRPETLKISLQADLVVGSFSVECEPPQICAASLLRPCTSDAWPHLFSVRSWAIELMLAARVLESSLNLQSQGCFMFVLHFRIWVSVHGLDFAAVRS